MKGRVYMQDILHLEPVYMQDGTVVKGGDHGGD